MKERVQKLIAERGVCSRRAAEKLIEEGRVRVNGRKIVLGAQATQNDLITIDGKRIAGKRQPPVYLLVHKPRGYITTASDERGRKTVMELIGEDVTERVYPVGRLDMASEGLLLLTNDGRLARHMTHPSSGIKKEYHVTVLGDVEKAMPLMAEGLTLDDGFKTQPAEVRVIKTIEEKTVLSVTISEGHNREVRRMCEAAGLTVRRLVRVAIGKLKLEGLAVGKCRPATASELKYLNFLTENRDTELK